VVSWLHNRVPAILASGEAARAWLNPQLSPEEALKILKPLNKSQLSWHPVSRDVGSVKNQGEDLPKPVELDKEGNQVRRESCLRYAINNNFSLVILNCLSVM